MSRNFEPATFSRIAQYVDMCWTADGGVSGGVKEESWTGGFRTFDSELLLNLQTS